MNYGTHCNIAEVGDIYNDLWVRGIGLLEIDDSDVIGQDILRVRDWK